MGKYLIKKEKGQGNVRFLTIPPQARRIEDKQGKWKNRLNTPWVVIVTYNVDDIHCCHNYSRQSPQYQASRGMVLPYKHKNRYRYKQRLQKVKKLSSQHNFKNYFDMSSPKTQHINIPTGIFTTPRSEIYYKKSPSIIKLPSK